MKLSASQVSATNTCNIGKPGSGAGLAQSFAGSAARQRLPPPLLGDLLAARGRRAPEALVHAPRTALPAVQGNKRCSESCQTPGAICRSCALWRRRVVMRPASCKLPAASLRMRTGVAALQGPRAWTGDGPRALPARGAPRSQIRDPHGVLHCPCESVHVIPQYNKVACLLFGCSWYVARED